MECSAGPLPPLTTYDERAGVDFGIRCMVAYRGLVKKIRIRDEYGSTKHLYRVGPELHQK